MALDLCACTVRSRRASHLFLAMRRGLYLVPAAMRFAFCFFIFFLLFAVDFPTPFITFFARSPSLCLSL